MSEYVAGNSPDLLTGSERGQRALEKQRCELVDDIAEKLIGDTPEDVDKGVSLESPRVGTLAVMRLTQAETALAYCAPGQNSDGSVLRPNLLVMSAHLEGGGQRLYVASLRENGEYAREQDPECVGIAFDFMSFTYETLQRESAPQDDLSRETFLLLGRQAYASRFSIRAGDVARI